MIKINKLLNRPERSYNKYLARKILKDISSWKNIDLIKHSYLNKLNLIDFPSILSLFYNLVNKTLQENLVDLILLSRSSKELDLACSNAATILARSDFIFKDIDFSRIRIPNADLSQRLFVDLNFEGSYLKEVNFVQSQFQNVNFKNCDLSCANFGYFKKINSAKGKGLTFSSDDKYFWYKNDENITGIDLENQEIRRETSLINFANTNISRIHSLRYKLSSATVHGQYIRLWDSYERKLIYDININLLAISPNLKYIAALDAKSTALSWDLEKKMQFLGTSTEHSYIGRRLLFSPSNQCLAIIRTHSIFLIETETWTLYRKVLGFFRDKDIIAISYNSQKIAFFKQNKIYLLDTRTSDKTVIFSTLWNKLRCISFSPCGNFLAFSWKENYGFIIDITIQQDFQIFAGFEGFPNSVIFSNSGKYISWGDLKGNIRIYEFSPKFCQKEDNRHLKINSANISPKGTYLITISQKNSILWDLNNFNPKQIKKFVGYNNNGDFIFSPYETYLVRKVYNKTEIYDVKRDYLIKTLALSNYWCRYYSFLHSEDFLICLYQDTYEYFRITDFLTTRTINVKNLNLTHIKFSDCGNYDFLYDKQNTLYIWDLVKGDCMKKIEFAMNRNMCAVTSFLSKISFLDTREKQNYIVVLDIETGDVINIPTGEEIPYSWCFADSNGTEIVGGFTKGVCKIWTIKDKSVKQLVRSLFSIPIIWVEAIGNHIIIKEKDNIEIFNLAELS